MRDPALAPRRGVPALLLVSLALALFGCAETRYRKVPTPTQYRSWTDEDQRQADAMDGVRYYLPRPFLHLKESVPVAQRVAFVSCVFKPKDTEKPARYEVSLPDDAPVWLRRSLPEEISVTQVFAAALARSEPGGAGSNLEADRGAGEGGASGTGEQRTNEKEADPDARPPSELTARTGFISDTDPVTRLGDRMDVVYLPDMEEQYVIQTDAGLGTADVETRLRNGWAAEVFSQRTDNSNLIPYVVRQVERASEAAAGIFTTWSPLFMGAPPGSVPSPEEALGALGLEADREDAAQKLAALLGEVVLFKVAEVKVAQPGLYPILKPREIEQWLRRGASDGGLVSGLDSQDGFEQFLVKARTPWIRPDMAFIPCPPFTVVGFNVTTDVFLAPANQAIQTRAEGAPNPGGGGAAALERAKGALRDALGRSLPAALGGKLLAPSGFEIRRGDPSKGELPTHTLVLMEAKGGALLTESDEAEAAAWVRSIFKEPRPEVVAKRIEIEGEPALLVTIPQPLASAPGLLKP